MMIKNTKVKCDVNICKHNEDYNCTLDTLNISSIGNNKTCANKNETICINFLR